MTDYVAYARSYAVSAHDRVGQKRKYTGEPYWHHCEAFAELVRTHGDGTPDMIAAAYLHDVVEDTDVSLTELATVFGDRIAHLVEQVTDVSKPTDGNRAHRKRLDREHLARSSSEAKTIKLADLIDNSRSILEHDRAFARVYIEEKKLLLDVLREGSPVLWSMADEIVTVARRSLKLPK